jgi:ABC-type Fe3+-hydroxamate transport system substrate-binding protein
MMNWKNKMIYQKLYEEYGEILIDGEKYYFDILTIREGWAEIKAIKNNRIVSIHSIPVNAEINKSFYTSGTLYRVITPMKLK